MLPWIPFLVFLSRTSLQPTFTSSFVLLVEKTIRHCPRASRLSPLLTQQDVPAASTTCLHSFSDIQSNRLTASTLSSLVMAATTTSLHSDDSSDNNNHNLDQSTPSTTTTTSTTNATWIVRPAQLDDKHQVDRLLEASYSNLLRNDYSDDVLQKALPLICTAQDSLLTCGTWFVVVERPLEKNDNQKLGEEPQLQQQQQSQIVGCGGFTLQPPKIQKQSDRDEKDEQGEVVPNQNPCDKRMVPHLRHFATDPAMARQGIASAIWKRTVSELEAIYLRQEQQQGDDIDNNSSCSTDASSSSLLPTMEVYSTLTAEPFYASLGFTKVQDVLIPLSEDCLFPSILMRRE